MPLFHNGYIRTLLNTFSLVKWYWQVLIIIGILFLTIFLHELAHFLTFVFMGIKNEVMIVFMFLFYKNKDNKWRIKINPQLLLLGGGLVWPNLGPINNDEDFKKARKAMQTSLLVAPLFTLISGVLFLLICLIFFYKTFLVPISFYMFLFTMFYTYTSTLESNQIIGDFKAYKKIKNDDDFSNLIILQYCDLTDYQYKYIKDYLKKNTYSNRKTRTYLGYLLEKYIFEEENVSMFLYKKILEFVKNEYKFISLFSHEEGVFLAQYILFYLRKCNHDDDTLRLFNLFVEKVNAKKTKQHYKNYLIKQTSHILGFSDESEYINNPKNMETHMLSFIMNSIPSFLEFELIKNKGFKIFEIKCDL